jgi:hypothetical protein
VEAGDDGQAVATDTTGPASISPGADLSLSLSLSLSLWGPLPMVGRRVAEIVISTSVGVAGPTLA